jgi:hypothetical protein
MVYTDAPRSVAESLDGDESVDLALFLEDGEVVARRNGDEDSSLLDDYPDGRERAEAALRNPNAGEVIVSAADGWEFTDLAGAHTAAAGATARSAGDSPSRCPALGSPAARAHDRRQERAVLGLDRACGRRVNQPSGGGWSSDSCGRDARRARADAMAKVPREPFVPAELSAHAYEDEALPSAKGRRSAAYMVARICEALRLRSERVLDVGTGPGTRRPCSRSSQRTH